MSEIAVVVAVVGMLLFFASWGIPVLIYLRRPLTEEEKDYDPITHAHYTEVT